MVRKLAVNPSAEGPALPLSYRGMRKKFDLNDEAILTQQLIMITILRSKSNWSGLGLSLLAISSGLPVPFSG